MLDEVLGREMVSMWFRQINIFTFERNRLTTYSMVALINHRQFFEAPMKRDQWGHDLELSYSNVRPAQSKIVDSVRLPRP